MPWRFFRRNDWKLEPVSKPRLRQDIARSCRVLLDLLAQLVYHHAKVLRLLTVVRPPDSLQQLFVRDRFSLLSYEKSQHIEFFGTEMDALTTHVHYSSLKIDTQLRAFELRKGFFRIRPTQGRSDTRQKFAYCKGFHDVIVGSGIERQNLVLFRISDMSMMIGPLKDDRILLHTSSPFMPFAPPAFPRAVDYPLAGRD